MAARISHTVHLKQLERNLGLHHADAARQIEHLSSGLRVNRSSDDPASLALADGIRSELQAIAQGTRNIQQTFSLLQVADGTLSEISSMIRRMQSLALGAASASFNATDRLNINAEFAQMFGEINRIAEATTYNGKHLLTGSNTEVSPASTAVADGAATGVTRVRLTGAEEGVYTFEDDPGDGTITLGNGVTSQTVVVDDVLDGSVVAAGSHVVVDFDRIGFQITLSGTDAPGARGQYADGDLGGRTIRVDSIEEFTFQVGPTGASNDVSVIAIADMRASSPGLALADISVVTIDDARRALAPLQKALEAVTAERDRIGTFQNRLELSLDTSNAVVERMNAAESDVRDADIARTVSSLAKSQILAEVATSIAVEADTNVSRVLALLQ